jgi:hypothetical protein
VIFCGVFDTPPPSWIYKLNIVNNSMPIGTTNISISSIASELQYTSGADYQLKGTLYNSSQLAYSANGGSYHNYNNMALSGLTDSFATAIEAKYTASQNMGLKNWAGYNHDHNVILNIRVNNGNPFDDAYVRIWLSTGPGPGATVLVNQVVPRSNTANVILTNFNTGDPAFSTYNGSGGYWIFGDISNIGGVAPAMPMNIAAAVDTDNVGGGTARLDYSSSVGAWDLITGPFFDVLVAGSNGGGWPNDGVSWNKRTTMIIDIL